MRLFLLSNIALAAVLVSGCTANQRGAGPAQSEESYSLDRHAQYYEAMRAHLALESRGGECGAE